MDLLDRKAKAARDIIVKHHEKGTPFNPDLDWDNFRVQRESWREVVRVIENFEDEELEREAKELQVASYPGGLPWGDLHESTRHVWILAARKAREIHGKGE